MPVINQYRVGANFAYRFWDVAESQGGPLKQFAPDASRIERHVLLAPGTFGDAVRFFVGNSQIVTFPLSGSPGGTGRYIARCLPHAYEDEQHVNPYTGQSWLFGAAIQRSDALAVADTSAYSGAPRGQLDRAVVMYGSRTYRLRDDTAGQMAFSPQVGQDNPISGSGPYPDEATLKRFITKRARPVSKIITLPRLLPKWVLEVGDKNFSAGTPAVAGPPVARGMGMSEASLELSYTWHEVPSLDVDPPEPAPSFTLIAAYMNSVNQFVFDGFLPGTLLMLAPDITAITNVIGQYVWNITYRFSYLPLPRRHDSGAVPAGTPVGHNAALRHIPRVSGPNRLDYRFVTSDGLPYSAGGSGNTPIYLARDFSKLFRPLQG